ncbi:MAG: UDP-galactopyranose mutase, partial [Clostridiales bacterium]|nr:UDP-galactopyranose mutase [Clostridiales bacterium]
VNALVDGIEVPLPLNFNSIMLLFDKDKANKLIQSLLNEYGENESVQILELRKSNVPDLKALADFVYEKIFLHYTTKMWGMSPTEISPSVTGRVPIRLSYDDRHFTHKYQVMPKFGYNKLFENMLEHEKIEVRLNANASDYISVDSKTGKIFFEGKPFSGRLIYTGSLDELFSFCYGELPYRTLRFEHATYKRDEIQQTAVLNFPDSRPETRRTAMKKLTQQKISGITSTLTEYPGAYLRGDSIWGEPYYPIINSEYLEIHKKYADLAKKIPNLYPVGRLAEYRYYNMEDTIKRGMETVENMR